jgi:hypothetical protein
MYFKGEKLGQSLTESLKETTTETTERTEENFSLCSLPAVSVVETIS